MSGDLESRPARPRALLALLVLVAAAPLLVRTDSVPRAQSAAPATIVSLTFDDGLAGAYRAGAILAAHGMHATFYVDSERLGSDTSYMSWRQVQNLVADGNEVGGHSAHHVALTTLDSAEARREVCDDRMNLLAHGIEATDFAYPYGLHDARIESIVEACGYNSSRTTEELSASDPTRDPYEVGALPGDDVGAVEAAILGASEHGGGWLPVAFHSLGDDPSQLVITSSAFSSFLDWLQAHERDGIRVDTVRAVIGGPVRAAVAGPEPPRAPSATSTLRNASLEVDANADGAPDCWQFGGYGDNTFRWSRTTVAHTGRYAEQLTVTQLVSGDGKLMVEQDLGSCTPTVTPGHRYTLSAWYRSNTPVWFTAFTRDRSGAFAYWRGSAQFEPGSAWRRATWTTPPVPPAVDGLSFGLTLASRGTMTVDDLSIVDPAGHLRDTVPPHVVLHAPSTRRVSGYVQLTASAADDSALDRLELLVDGRVAGVRVDGPQTFDWNTRLVAPGAHRVSVRAIDTAGNSATTSTVLVDVENAMVNRLRNPSLEAAVGETPDCWSSDATGVNVSGWQRTSAAHTGASAVELDVTHYDVGDRKLVSVQDDGACAPAVVAGRRYVVTAWYRGDAPAYLYAYVRSAAGRWAYLEQSLAQPPSAVWREAIWSTPPLPSGATRISVGAGLAGTGSLTLDDLGLFGR